MSTIQGVIHGKTIELNEETGLPDGEVVKVSSQRMDKAPDDLPRAELWMDRLVFDSAVHPYYRVVKGTRLIAEALVGELAQGLNNDEMIQTHPELSMEDVVALRHYARSPAGLRQSFGGWAEDAEELDKYLKSLREQRRIRRREIEE